MPTKPRNDLDVLSPMRIEVDLDGRIFVQKPLTLRGTSRLVTVLATELQAATASPALAALLELDIQNTNAMVALPAIVQILATLPDAFAKIVTIILTGDTKEDDVEYVAENIGLPLTMKVLRTFMEQNEPEELVANFMVLRSMLNDALTKGTKAPMTA